MAGQTAGRKGLKFFKETHSYHGGNIGLKKFRTNLVFSIDFF